MKPLFFILCLLAVFYQSRGQAVDTNLVVEINSSGRPDTAPTMGRSTNLLATGAWSEPVSDGHGNRLRGRLLVYEGTHFTNLFERWSTAPVYLEIRDATESNQHPIRIYFDLADGITFQLRDAHGAPAGRLRDGNVRGAVPRPFWAVLPAGGLLRWSANNPLGNPTGRPGEVSILFRAGGSWIIPADDTNDWFLSATLSPPPTNSTPDSSDVWQASLEFPAVRLSAFKEPQTVGTNLILERPGSGRVETVPPRWGDTNLIFEIKPNGLADTESNPTRGTNLVATGPWSEPVSDGHGNNLRARLLAYQGMIGPNQRGRNVWSAAPVYLEIQNVTGTNQHPTRIYFDFMEGLIFELRDANGAPADKVRDLRGYRGGVPPPFWATWPASGLLRLRANAGLALTLPATGLLGLRANGGREGPMADKDDLHLTFFALRHGEWVIPAGDTNAWFLSATLLPPPPTNSTPYDSDVWQGLLAVPTVKLSLVKH
jgi:hypothetical protein